MSSPVLVLMTTWFPKGREGERLPAVLQAVESWERHLRWPHGFHVHIADDGSEPNVLREVIQRACQWAPVTQSRQERRGVGASLNAGFDLADALGYPLVLYAVDDWALDGEMDLTPWGQMLLDDTSLGVVRVGMPHPGLRGHVEQNTYGWHLVLDRYGYAYSHRPALLHGRFFRYYGRFNEGLNALDTERLYAERWAELSGPGIIQALYSPWHHIDSIELADVQP